MEIPSISRRRAIDRRGFLRGAGVALALPFLDAMVPAVARAASSSGATSNSRILATVKGLEMVCACPMGSATSS